MLCQRLPSENMTQTSNKRVMMGKSACDDGVKGIERDLKNQKRDTQCNSKVILFSRENIFFKLFPSMTVRTDK